MHIGLAAAITLLAACLPASAGHAAADPTDQCALDSDNAIAAQLARHPGGTRVDTNTVSYDDGALSVHVFPSTCASLDGQGDCDSGVACFWERSRYRGNQWVLSGKGKWVDLRIDRFGSVHNNHHTAQLLLRRTRDTPTVKVYGSYLGSPNTLPSGARRQAGTLDWACLSTRGSGGCD
ncbi:peptidase inhibitor family I36 protein [Nonomuraea sp. NPDC003754]